MNFFKLLNKYHRILSEWRETAQAKLDSLKKIVSPHLPEEELHEDIWTIPLLTNVACHFTSPPAKKKRKVFEELTQEEMQKKEETERKEKEEKELKERQEKEQQERIEKEEKEQRERQEKEEKEKKERQEKEEKEQREREEKEQREKEELILLKEFLVSRLQEEHEEKIKQLEKGLEEGMREVERCNTTEEEKVKQEAWKQFQSCIQPFWSAETLNMVQKDFQDKTIQNLTNIYADHLLTRIKKLKEDFNDLLSKEDQALSENKTVIEDSQDKKQLTLLLEKSSTMQEDVSFYLDTTFTKKPSPLIIIFTFSFQAQLT